MKRLVRYLVAALAAFPLAAAGQGFPPPYGYAPPPLSAQDPADVLRVLISTFQNCGPQANYFMLGQYVFNLIYLQTGGMGCTVPLRALGPLQRLERVSSFQMPAGPVTTYRAIHAYGVGLWQIGISRWTQKVELLIFQPGGAAPPPAGGDAGDDDGSEYGRSRPDTAPPPPRREPFQDGNTAPRQPEPGPPPNNRREPATHSLPSERVEDPSQGCAMYPDMCSRPAR